MIAATQQIRFVPVAGGRVAVATTGQGPPLVLPPPWISHVELEWEFPEYRAFVTALATEHTVIRYDRLGIGLSDADPAGDRADVGTEAGRLADLSRAWARSASPSSSRCPSPARAARWARWCCSAGTGRPSAPRRSSWPPRSPRPSPPSWSARAWWTRWRGAAGRTAPPAGG
jgi:hypothetical protein